MNHKLKSYHKHVEIKKRIFKKSSWMIKLGSTIGRGVVKG
jgi:hypothetical protein